MERRESQAVFYSSACHGLVHFNELTYPAVLVLIASEFGSDLFLLGIVANISAFAFGAGALPAGFLSDRIGERRLLYLCMLGAGVATLIVGLSPNLIVLSVALAGLGVVLGLYHPAGAAFITKVAKSPAMAFGYLGIGGNLGIAFGPFIAASVAALLGWRASYLVLVLPLLLLGALIYRLPRTEAAPIEPTPSRPDLEKMSSRSTVVPLVIIYLTNTLLGFIYRGSMTFLPLYIMDRVRFSLFNIDSVALAGSFTTIALLFGIAGSYLGGRLPKRGQLERWLMIAPIVLVPALLVMGTAYDGVLMVAASVYAFSHFAGQPMLNALVAKYTPTRWRGRSYGITFFCAFGLGSFAAGVSGYLAENLGTNWVFIMLAGVGILMFACVLVLVIMAPRWSTQEMTPS